jgi:hypothetical protein
MFLTLNDVNSSEDQTIKPCEPGLDDRIFVGRAMVGRGGLEPPTSRLSGVRSNHLSYRPISRAPASAREGWWSLSGSNR